MTLQDFKPGQWVRLHPASDWFMRGVLFATVTKVGRKWLTLDWHDGNGHSITVRVLPRDVQEVL